MALQHLVSVPVLPKPPTTITDDFNLPRISIQDEYTTPRSSIDDQNTLSDSSPTITDHSSSEDFDDDEDHDSISSHKHVKFSLRSSTSGTSVRINNDEAEFFTVTPTIEPVVNQNIEESGEEKEEEYHPKQHIRKRDKIRALFHRKFSHTHSNVSDQDPSQWSEALAKTLVAMHHDVEEIITNLDQMEQPVPDTSSTTDESNPIITAPRLSFRERQRAKLEMIRMAQMLYPPNLLTYNAKESPYPYTDIIEPTNFDLILTKKKPLLENHFIQHKPFRHDKFRYRTQRALLRMRHDIKKMKRNIYGKHHVSSSEELPPVDVQNYRNRLEKTLHEVRKQIEEYDRVNSSSKHRHRQSISQVIAKMHDIDPHTKAIIDDYRANARSVEYVDKKRTELISAPFIPRRARPQPIIKKRENDNPLVDRRFDPTTFIDLNDQVDEFFGPDIPFWDQPPELQLSSLSPTFRRQSVAFIFPEKKSVWNRMVHSFQSKQKKLRNAESKKFENYDDDDDNLSNQRSNDEFFDCTVQSSARPSTTELMSVDF